LRTKVNANIGTSPDYPDVPKEMVKLQAAVDAGADAVMDLSTGGDLPAIRQRMLEACPVALGTVPIYEAASTALQSGKGLCHMTPDEMIDTVRRQAEQGVDFVTVHCAVLRETVQTLKGKRVCGIVSRGGAILAEWMTHNEAQNPFYDRFDDLLAIAAAHEVTLSLGDGLRPGAGADSFDQAQMDELRTIAELVLRCRAAGVQCMVEGPGHVPLHEVAEQVRVQKRITHGAPFYVLGPLVTDIAPGYDHITGAIGGAVAASAGADFLCYVTPAEHLGLPSADQVRAGVMASRIAAHAGDIACGLPGAAEWDRRFSQSRRQRDWDAMLHDCIDPKAAASMREAVEPEDETVCSMCGDLCVYKVAGDHF
jgi:phosphomethylpyrimidine synthase